MVSITFVICLLIIDNLTWRLQLSIDGINGQIQGLPSPLPVMAVIQLLIIDRYVDTHLSDTSLPGNGAAQLNTSDDQLPPAPPAALRSMDELSGCSAGERSPSKWRPQPTNMERKPKTVNITEVKKWRCHRQFHNWQRRSPLPDLRAIFQPLPPPHCVALRCVTLRCVSSVFLFCTSCFISLNRTLKVATKSPISINRLITDPVTEFQCWFHSQSFGYFIALRIRTDLIHWSGSDGVNWKRMELIECPDALVAWQSHVTGRHVSQFLPNRRCNIFQIALLLDRLPAASIQMRCWNVPGWFEFECPFPAHWFHWFNSLRIAAEWSVQISTVCRHLIRYLTATFSFPTYLFKLNCHSLKFIAVSIGNLNLNWLIQSSAIGYWYFS